MPTNPTNAPDAVPLWAEQQRARRTLVVVDVVESVRLMLAYEADVIDRWRRFVGEVSQQVLPAYGGRLVKSLGDGLLLEFEAVPQAVAASLEMQRRMPAYNVGRPGDAAMHLRAGAHEAEVVVDKLDVFGSGVNLAARLTSLAGPGDTVVSAAVRDKLIPDVDAVIHDMGDCYLKHIEQPIRAFRLAPVGHTLPPITGMPRQRALVPRLAIMPLVNASDEARLMRVGESLGDDLIGTMSRCAYWQITSRLSTAALAQRQLELSDIGELLRVDFVLTGSVSLAGPHAHVRCELAEVTTGTILWNEAYSIKVEQLMVGTEAFAPRVSAHVMKALLRREMALSHVAAMPTLPSYALLLQAISLMHSVVPSQFARSEEVLTYLEDRHPRSPDVFGWLGQWHLFQLFQWWSRDPARSVASAKRHLDKALDLDSNHSLALSIRGHLALAIERDIHGAEVLIRRALMSNPNESLGWLFLAQSLVYQERLEESLAAVDQARLLSPLDPMAYFHDVFAASILGGIGKHKEALACAERAVLANANHLPSLAVLVIAYTNAGNLEKARFFAQRYVSLRPNASVSAYLAAHPAPESRVAKNECECLLEAGIPS